MTMNDVLALVRRGDCAAIDRLYDEGGLNDLENEEKNLLAREAAKAGQAQMLRHLFEHHHLYGTDDDRQGRTLLHFAAQSGDAETIAFARNVLGYDALTADASGLTALDYAARAPRREGEKWLKDALGFGLADCYRNPVLRGFHPDPSLVRVGADYYMVSSTFAFFPGLPISHSRDLIHWEVIGHAVENLEWSGLEGLPGGYGYWAPDISYYHGKFWVVATLRRNSSPVRLQMLTWARDPRGPWSKPKFLPLDGIDPSLFADDDGRRYILLNPGAILAEINEEGDLISDPEMIYFGSTRVKSEGPHLLKKDGWYYLFLAEGGTGAGHCETVARARNLRGPYQRCPWNPILGRVNAHCPLGRSGHGKPVSTPDGRWYMAYLCGRQVEGETVMGRETALDPMTWSADGWPMVNELRGPSVVQRCPLGVSSPCRNREWISPRSNPADFAVWEGNSAGAPRCSGDPAALERCSVLVRRQTEPNFFQSVTVDAQFTAPGSVSGIIGYYDERSFFLLGITPSSEIFLIEQAGDQRRQKMLDHADVPRVRLRVEGQGLTRTLMRQTENGWMSLAVIRAAYLADGGVKGAKRFTGATLGLAALGSGTAAFTDYEDEMWE